jgi:excisionase family DNA binding protein
MELRMKALISIAECEEMLGISRSTVYRLVERGQLTFVHIGRAVRIRRDEVEAFYTPAQTEFEP